MSRNYHKRASPTRIAASTRQASTPRAAGAAALGCPTFDAPGDALLLEADDDADSVCVGVPLALLLLPLPLADAEADP